MLKKTLTLMLVALLLQMTSSVMKVSAVPNDEMDAALAKKVRAEVMRIGQQAHVTVKFKDNTKLEGYIIEIGAEHFVIKDARTGVSTTIAYPQVKQVKRNNLSAGAKIGIVVAIAAAVGIIIAVAGGRNSDNNTDAPPCTRTAQVGVPCPPGCICIQ
ncbi:MAG TPA: hypothetical protein VGC66_13250 [Pyrinomonadaceae bacterium]|jgi:hypothetical protein